MCSHLRISLMAMRITENSSDLDMGPGPELKSVEFSVIRIVIEEKILILIEVARR